MKTIIFFVCAILALTLSYAHAINTGDPARDAQINSDPRQLHLKKWIHGPVVDTLENYEFNVAIWNVQVESLRVDSNMPIQDDNFLAGLQSALRELKLWQDECPELVTPISDFLTCYANAYVRNPPGNSGWWLRCREVPVPGGYFLGEQVCGAKGQNLAERDIAAWLRILSNGRQNIHTLEPSFFSEKPYFDEFDDQAPTYVTKRFYQDLAIFKLITFNMLSDGDCAAFAKRVGKNIEDVFKEALVMIKNRLLPLENENSQLGNERKHLIFFLAAYIKHKLDIDFPGYLNAADLRPAFKYMFSLIESCPKKIQLHILHEFFVFLESKHNYFLITKPIASLYDCVLTYVQDIPAWMYEEAAGIFLSYKMEQKGKSGTGHEYIPYHIKARECYEKAIKLYGNAVSFTCLAKPSEAYRIFDGLENTEYKIQSLERSLALHTLCKARKEWHSTSRRSDFLFTDLDFNLDQMMNREPIRSQSFSVNVEQIIKKEIEELKQQLDKKRLEVRIKLLMYPEGESIYELLKK